MEQVLEKLFESTSKVRLIRLFVRNPDRFFTMEEILKLCQTNPATTRNELIKLHKLGLIHEKYLNRPANVEQGKHFTKKRKKSQKNKTGKNKVYFVNKEFPILDELRDLMGKAATASRKLILREARKIGRIKMLVLCGVFIRNENARTDLLIVAEKIKKGRLENFLRGIESELGKPIQYALMDTQEFKYRHHMYDRFLRDILESPHETLIDMIKIQ